ncbi:MAG: hypothetical protein LBK58_00535 [Prevotellaceae bacterium]|nr:hypothetical protein [Prevotellaceae bacterium]
MNSSGVLTELGQFTPELRFACTGLSKLDACGVKRHEVSLHFYITILARAKYINRLLYRFNFMLFIIIL